MAEKSVRLDAYRSHESHRSYWRCYRRRILLALTRAGRGTYPYILTRYAAAGNGPRRRRAPDAAMKRLLIAPRCSSGAVSRDLVPEE